MTPPQSANSEFLLVGNGSYQNRGCEAIVRGTMEILRRKFGAEVRARAGVYAGVETIQQQNKAEIDPAIAAFALESFGRRWSQAWWATQANKRLRTTFVAHHRPLLNRLAGACVALEVGGDNYSLDYGRPEHFMAMDRFLQQRGMPVVLWGASVGPFDTDLEFAPRMFDHLRSLSGIFVRESSSFDYLRANGVVENLALVADPAFVMRPLEPPLVKIEFSVPEGAVGINLSPLVARYREPHCQSPDLSQWLATCAGLVKAAANELKRPIILVPHVASNDPWNDDFGFLEELCKTVINDVCVPVQVAPRGLGAAELKWIIAKCSIFAGARTHATIAALSSHVPTLSIGYSLKARGINHDIFGHLDYCIPVSDLNAENFVERLGIMAADSANIRAHLASRIPAIQKLSFSAGPLLRQFVSDL